MNRLRWLAMHWAKELGPSGLAGLVLLALAVALCLGGILPGRMKLQQLAQASGVEQLRQKTAMASPAAGTRSVGARLNEFYRFFPSHRKSPQLLDAIYAAAGDESVSLPQGKYKFHREKAGRLDAYQVNLPVQGSYVQIRKFIVKVLNTVPSAALDEVGFKRASVGNTQLEARIRFVVYLDAA